MIAVDSSVVVAAFAAWHEGHPAAMGLLESESSVALPAHAALESYSVLTRLPAPYRVSPESVGRFLGAWFGERLTQLSQAAHADFRTQLVELGISGGAVYDALIAATARQIGATLATFDARAQRTYGLIGVEVLSLSVE